MARRAGTPDRARYAAAGVDVAAADRAVALIAEQLEGGTNAARSFAAPFPVPPGYREPVLVSTTDGVGTKTAIARAVGRFETIGQDLVAMCADDVVCQGAEPLFFLDYLAVGRVEPAYVAELVRGIARACESIGCALVGGETAEHPGLMEPEAFDLAGFCVGIAEREQLLDARSAQAGDVLIGLASSGLHANGFSLVRALVAEADLDLRAPYLETVQRILDREAADRVARDEPEHVLATLGEVLLTPTRVYARDVLAVRDALLAHGTPLRALAHVTGGGLPGNIPRVLPDALAALVDPDTWSPPSVFQLLATLGRLDGAELRATFNCGVGMVAVVPPQGVEAALRSLSERGLPGWRIGEVVAAGDIPGERYAERPGALGGMVRPRQRRSDALGDRDAAGHAD